MRRLVAGSERPAECQLVRKQASETTGKDWRSDRFPDLRSLFHSPNRSQVIG